MHYEICISNILTNISIILVDRCNKSGSINSNVLENPRISLKFNMKMWISLVTMQELIICVGFLIISSILIEVDNAVVYNEGFMSNGLENSFHPTINFRALNDKEQTFSYNDADIYGKSEHFS